MLFGSSKAARGFTLIEMLVVVAIIGIMTAITLVGMGNSRMQNDLDAAAKEFVAVAREVQTDALAGRSLKEDTIPCATDPYTLSWTANANYQVVYTPKDTTGNCDATNTASIAYTLKNGVTFSSAGSVSYSVPFGTVNATTMVGLLKNSKHRYVCIYASGNVTDQTSASCP